MQKKSFNDKLKEAIAWLVQGNNRAKFFFFVLSVFLWFLIKLSKPGYVKEYRFPLQFSNLPQNKLIVEKPVAYADVTLKGDGFVLLKYALTSLKSTNVDLSSLRRKANGTYYWLPPSNSKKFQQQLTDGVEVLSIFPDTLNFKLSTLAEKKVPVRAKIKVAAALGKKLYNKPKVKPDSIFIAGPQKAIEEINFVETELWTIEKGQGTQSKTLGFNWQGAKEIKAKVKQIDVQVDLASITEETIKVPIIVENIPDSLQVEIFPKQVQIRYRVALRDYEKVQAEEFAVIANFKEILKNPSNQFMNLSIDDYPKFIEEIILDPKRVEYIVTKK